MTLPLAAEIVSIDPVTLVIYLAGVVGATVAVLTFFDHRWDRKLEAHQEADEERAEARHQEVMLRLEALITRLVDHGALPSGPSASGSWPLHRPDHRSDD